MRSNEKDGREKIMHTPTAKSITAAAVSRMRFVSLLAMVAVIALAFSGSAFAQCPTAITNMSPAAGTATTVPTSGSLRWNVTGGSADYFNIYFGVAGSGACQRTTVDPNQDVVSNFGGTTGQIDYTDLAPNTTYEWKVEAVKNGCTKVVSSCATFKTGCSTVGPTLINPPNGVTDDHLKVAFVWDPVYGANGYEVFVDGASIGTTTAATELIKDIPAGQHSWYVNANVTGCAPAKSETWTFGTSCPTGTTSLINPSNNSTLSSGSGIQFQWTAVSGADGYDVYVQQGTGAATKIGQTREAGTVLAGTTITADVAGTGTFSWFVDVLSSGCPTVRATASTFTIADTCPKTAPTLSAPANNASVTGDVTFTWSAVTVAGTNGFLRYDLHVISDGKDVVLASIPSATTTTITQSLAAGSYSWYVQAVFSACPSLTSTTSAFTVAAPKSCPTAGPTLSTPAEGASNVTSPVSLSWTAVTGATSYNVYAGVGGATPSLLTQTTGTTFSALLGSGAVAWYVEAVVDGCANITSTTGNFTIPAPPTCPTVGPNLTSPADNGSTVRRTGEPSVFFAWDAFTGATGYILTVIKDGGTPVSVNVPKEETSFQGAPFDWASGSLEWYVTATLDGCANVSSAHRRYTVNAPPPCVLTAPTLISPLSTPVLSNNRVTFKWNAVGDALEYRVYAQNVDGDTTLNEVGRTTGGETILENVELPWGANRWYVQAFGAAGCTAAKSAIQNFTLTKPITCVQAPPQVTLTTPANNASTTDPKVQLIWSPVNGAQTYQAFIVPFGGAATPVGDATTATSAELTLTPGVYQWYVRSTSSAWCDAQVSATSTFTVQAVCNTKPPKLSTPNEGASDVPTTATLNWTSIQGATSYDVYAKTGNGDFSPVGAVIVTGSGGKTTVTVPLKAGATTWYVEAKVPGPCGTLRSAEGHFTVVAPPACTTPNRTVIALQGTASSGQEYPVRWKQVANSFSYEIDESTSSSFATVTTRTVNGTEVTYVHDVGVDTTYYYRVRAKSSCNTTISENSAAADIKIQAPKTQTSDQKSDLIGSVGTQQTILQTIYIAGVQGASFNFTASVDKSWLTVKPASGVLPAAPGGVTLQLLADSGNLQAGANTGTINLVFTQASAGSHATELATPPPSSIPVSVSLVTPVLPAAKTSASAQSLIVPSVASAKGAASSQWQTDARLTNVSAQNQRYTLYFNPSGSDASLSGKSTNLDVEPGQTVALDSLLKNWYGVAVAQSMTGVFEIRPTLSGTSTSLGARQTVASSRTFNNTANGTYGQYVPAVPFSQFVGKGVPITLTQLAQSSNYRTNIGVVEGAGEAVTFKITPYNASGTPLPSVSLSLKPGEQRQWDSFFTTYGGLTGENLRADVEVTSDTGRITAYASVIDMRTNDPLLVTPKSTVKLAENAVIIGGVADYTQTGYSWKSDIRVYNGGTSTVNATATYYPREDVTKSKAVSITIAPGEVKAYDNVLQSLFSLTNTGGEVVISTATPAAIVASGRTYAQTASGTIGQYVEGVSSKGGTAKGGNSLHVLQLEESNTYRTNAGVYEIGGKDTKVQISAVLPEGRTTSVLEFWLKPYEFRQFEQIFKQMGVTGSAYNARIAAKVIDGDGRIAAYGSVVDFKTNDPTYVPGQQ